MNFKEDGSSSHLTLVKRPGTPENAAQSEVSPVSETSMRLQKLTVETSAGLKDLGAKVTRIIRLIDEILSN